MSLKCCPLLGIVEFHKKKGATFDDLSCNSMGGNAILEYTTATFFIAPPSVYCKKSAALAA